MYGMLQSWLLAVVLLLPIIHGAERQPPHTVTPLPTIYTLLDPPPSSAKPISSLPKVLPILKTNAKSSSSDSDIHNLQKLWVPAINQQLLLYVLNNSDAPPSLEKAGNTLHAYPKYLRQLLTALIVSNGVLVPVSFHDVVNGNWVHSWSYKMLLTAVEWRVKYYEDMKKHNISIPPLKLHFIVSTPQLTALDASRKLNRRYDALLEKQKHEITQHIKKTVSDALEVVVNDGGNYRNKESRELYGSGGEYHIHVEYVPTAKEPEKIYKAMFSKNLGKTEEKMKQEYRSAQEWSDHMMKEKWMPTSLDEQQITAQELTVMSESDRIAELILKGFRKTMAMYSPTFSIGLDLEFGVESERLLRDALAAYDEATQKLEYRKYVEISREYLKERLISDLQLQYNSQIQKLRISLFDEFKDRMGELQMTPLISSQLTSLMKSVDGMFLKNLQKIKGSWIRTNEQEIQTRLDLQHAMREVANMVLEFARLNGVSTEKPLRKPISLSFHYLSPNAFGLNDFSRELSGNPNNAEYRLNPSVMMSGGDARLGKQNNRFVPYDVPLDVKSLANSMVYDAPKR